jgi:hypothetical protein
MTLRATFKNIGLAIVGALISIPLTVNIEELVHYRTPGMHLAFALFPHSQGTSVLGESMLVSVGLDSVLCFAAICGLYALYFRLSR